jgi:hypothetical protein
VTSRARLIGTSFGAGLLLTAAQLGMGGGLGLLDWRTSASFNVAVTWVAFIFTAATLGGVAAARRRVPVVPVPLIASRRPAWRVAAGRAGVALAAGTGAMVALPFVWLPVSAGVPGVSNAGGTVIACAAGGVAVGLIFGVAAMASGPVAAASAASVLWLWVAALASAILAAIQGGPTGARLGVIESASHWWSGPYAMIGLYAALALTVALIASRLGASRRQIALSGLIGPALLASAYAVAGNGPAGSAGSAGSTASGGGPLTSVGSVDVVGTFSSGGDVRVAALIAAAAGLLSSTVVAMRSSRSTVRTSAGATTVTWPTVAQVAPAVAPAPPPPPAPAPAPARAPAASARRATSAGASTKPARKARTKAASSPAPAAPAPAAAPAAPPPPAPASAAVPKQRKSAASAAVPKGRRSAARKRTAPAEPVAAKVPAAPTPAPDPSVAERLAAAPGERLSRREREHVKWMENLLNTPADPTLTTRRRSS